MTTAKIQIPSDAESLAGAIFIVTDIIIEAIHLCSTAKMIDSGKVKSTLVLLLFLFISSLITWYFFHHAGRSFVRDNGRSKNSTPPRGHSSDDSALNAARPLSGDVLEMGHTMRAFKKLFKKRKSGNLMAPLEISLYAALEHKLFPWIKSSTIVELLNGSQIPRGIVMSTGRKYFAMAVHTIRVLRHWNCTLPIEVFYQGHTDLDEDSIQFLNSMPNVRAIDLNPIFDNEILMLRGWDTKPFAILAASFKEVILLDADVVLLQNPEIMFEYSEYKNTGALFFSDRSILLHQKLDYPTWFKRIVPEPHSAKLKASRMYQGVSHFEQESGVVVIDKIRASTGLLTVCCLNSQRERHEMRTHSYGEKETFWFGFEISEDKYTFYDKSVGVIGVMAALTRSKDIVITGNIAHFDSYGQLLWFNGGIVTDKTNPISPLVHFRYLSTNGRWEDLDFVPKTWDKIPKEIEDRLNSIQELWNPLPLH